LQPNGEGPPPQEVPIEPQPMIWSYRTVAATRVDKITGAAEPISMILVRVSNPMGNFVSLLSPEEAESISQNLHSMVVQAKHGFIVPGSDFRPLGEDKNG